MGRRDDKLTHAAHIKRHTVGTSNEISFSVLDAAKLALDGDRVEEKKRPPVGLPSLFTLPGKRKKPVGTPTKESGLPLSTGDFVSVDNLDDAGSFGTFDFSAAVPPASVPVAERKALSAAPAKPKRSPEEEIARRKARRRLSKIAAIAVVVVITGALAAAGVGYLYHEHQVQQSNVATLDEALRLINEANDTIVSLDAAVTDPFAADAAAVRESVRTALPGIQESLVTADEKARAAAADLRESTEKEAAFQAITAIAARQTLLEYGAQIMDAAEEAQTAIDQVEAAWQQVLAADELARAAAQLVTDTTPENVQASKDKTNEALAAFGTAKQAFFDAQAFYPTADLSAIVAYLEKREEALSYAIASDDAFLAKDKETAVAQNDAYNAADAEAAALAKELPADPTSLVLEAYEVGVADLTKAYSTARLQAAGADAFISDYLGAEIK